MIRTCGYDLKNLQEEIIAKTIAAQEAKFKAYDVLTLRGLAVPPDLERAIDEMTNPRNI